MGVNKPAGGIRRLVIERAKELWNDISEVRAGIYFSSEAEKRLR